MARRIAYVMSRFPHLPETFILREMIELERHGIDVVLYPLILQRQPVVHPEAQVWIPRARPVKFFSPRLLADIIRAVLRQPAVVFSLWATIIIENIASAHMLVRSLALIPKAIHTAQLMRAEGINHIHAHYATHPALLAWVVHRLTGIPYSFTAHAHDIFVRKTMINTKIRDAEFLIAISQYNRNYLAMLAGEQVKQKIHVVRCGINLNDYRPAARFSDNIEMLDILSVGSLQPYKGQTHLIEACRLLEQRGLNFRCRIVGEGSERRSLENQIAAAGLQTKVTLLGARTQQEVASILATANCYVQPSIVTASGKMEGIPVALMEAMASELPVVASNLSGIPELVRHNETGYLVPPGNAQAIADTLQKIFGDFATARQVAKRGRKVVEQEFELSANVAELANLFQNTLSTSTFEKA